MWGDPRFSLTPRRLRLARRLTRDPPTPPRRARLIFQRAAASGIGPQGRPASSAGYRTTTRSGDGGSDCEPRHPAASGRHGRDEWQPSGKCATPDRAHSKPTQPYGRKNPTGASNNVEPSATHHDSGTERSGSEPTRDRAGVGNLRLTVRKIVRSNSTELKEIPRAEKAEPHRPQILELLNVCKGNLVRVHEELMAGGAARSYPRSRLSAASKASDKHPSWRRASITSSQASKGKLSITR